MIKQPIKLGSSSLIIESVMHNKSPILLAIVLLFSLPTHAASIEQTEYQSGFQEITIMDKHRPLQVAIWYPTNQQQPLEKIGDNAIFNGENAVKNAKITGVNHPLMLISHGFSGSWRNQTWLAAALSRNGYIVAAPNHPGTTTQNMNRTIAQNMLERPNDISRTLTYLLSDNNFAKTVDLNRIGVVGHSYGGWTAIELIGGRFSASQFEQSCQSPPLLASCKIFHQQMQGLAKESDYYKLDKSMHDSRIRAAFIFDLGFAQGFTSNSLANISVPALIISVKNTDQTPSSELESQYLIQYMPSNTTEYLSLEGATHFSFIGLCKAKAIEILKEEKIDESYICEYDTDQRQAIHQFLVDKIIAYMH